MDPRTVSHTSHVAIAVLINRDVVVIEITDVCMFGIPWRKTTAIAANYVGILKLQ